MLQTIKNMTVVEFAHWWQRVHGFRAEYNNYWEVKQRELVQFLEEVEKHLIT